MAVHKTTDYINFNERLNPDWICHLVMVGSCDGCGNSEYSPLSPYLCDCHTHGLEKYGSKELQLVVKMQQNMIGYLLNTVGAMIRAGAELKDGDYIDCLLEGYLVLITKNEDSSGKEILRIVVPDVKGLFPKDEGCDTPYSLQGLSTYMINNGFSGYN